MGAEQYAEHVSKDDAEVVRLLRKAGAIIIGKANTHQFAYGSTGDRSFFGAVRNPRNPSRVPGGSSSGSAASVAAGLAYGSVGTDTSASIRLPAALCGVVGMKATLGLISRQGVFPLSETLDHVGPISTCVQDNALLLEVMSDSPLGAFSSKIGQSIRGLVIGVPGTFYSEYISPAVSRSMLAARQALEAAGAVVKSVEIDNIY
ncbi:MAG: amidase family protein, partial [Pollutimonas bauzanensis]